MGLKRKRSSDLTYSPLGSSSSSVTLSLPFPNPWQAAPLRPDMDVQMELNFPIVKHRTDGDDSGRTRKRWRDRPDEHAIQSRFTDYFSAWLIREHIIDSVLQTTRFRSCLMRKSSDRMQSLYCHMSSHFLFSR
jgi:hypothetical protein